MVVLLKNSNHHEAFGKVDPISPYLFVLMMEKLGHVIKGAVSNGSWKPISLGRGGPKLSHLFFVDDLVLFGEASLETAMMMKAIIDQFYVFLGHKVNSSKSMLHFSLNTSNETRNEIRNVFNF